MFERLIQNITDVPGVEGVCLFDLSGRVAVNYLPDFFVAEMLRDLAQRIISLFQTVDDSYLPCNEYLLKYPHRWLSIRRGESVYILALCSPTVSAVSLRMVTNLALKNVTEQMLESAYSIAEPPPARAAAEPPRPMPAPRPVQVPQPIPTTSQPAILPSTQPAEEATQQRRHVAVRPKRAYRGTGY